MQGPRSAATLSYRLCRGPPPGHRKGKFLHMSNTSQAGQAAADRDFSETGDAPVGSFRDFPLGPSMKAALDAVGYEQPTPIQGAVIGPALQGKDVLGQARTGTGKTAAFLIPILERIEDGGPTQALVLTPTRELGQQVKEEADRLRGDRAFKIIAAYGGTHLRRQIQDLEDGVQLVVGTPGRILDLLRRGALRTDRLKTVVLDEADRMLDIGFRPDIERILRQTPDSRQTLLLSATMPDALLQIVDRYMKKPVRLNLSEDDLSVDTIEQRYITADPERKKATLMRLLAREKPRQALIFCQMKVTVRKVAEWLGKRINGVVAMEGDMNQNVRNRTMQGFRDGSIRIMVATDLVGRGIDVQGISHVINYDVPQDVEAYVHRIGRTGRMGKDGTAYTLVTPDQGPTLTDIEMLINKQIVSDEIDGFIASPSMIRRKAARMKRSRENAGDKPLARSSRHKRALAR